MKLRKLEDLPSNAVRKEGGNCKWLFRYPARRPLPADILERRAGAGRYAGCRFEQ